MLVARLIITNESMCAYTFSAYVIVTHIIGLIIGVNRGAITKERKRSEGRSRKQTQEATQEAENVGGNGGKGAALAFVAKKKAALTKA